jgi:hypothetical protein
MSTRQIQSRIMAHFGHRSQGHTDLQGFRSTVFTILLRIATFSYSWSLSHYTTEPISEIAKYQEDRRHVILLLLKFKDLKKQELQFVRAAVRILPHA